jgi:hypothetical protein
MLAKYISNYETKAHGIKVPTSQVIDLPPLKIYVYNQVTGRIIQKTAPLEERPPTATPQKSSRRSGRGQQVLCGGPVGEKEVPDSKVKTLAIVCLEGKRARSGSGHGGQDRDEGEDKSEAGDREEVGDEEDRPGDIEDAGRRRPTRSELSELDRVVAEELSKKAVCMLAKRKPRKMPRV